MKNLYGGCMIKTADQAYISANPFFFFFCKISAAHNIFIKLYWFLLFPFIYVQKKKKKKEIACNYNFSTVVQSIHIIYLFFLYYGSQKGTLNRNIMQH